MLTKGRGRPFEPGNQYGRGRPRGSHNKEKSAGEKLLLQYEEQLITKALTMAMEGNTQLINTLLKCLYPAGNRKVQFPMRKVRTIPEIHRAFQQLTEAVGDGVLTPTEGASVSRMLEAQTRILEKTDTVVRVEKLEQKAEREAQRERSEGEAALPLKEE